MQQHIVQEYSIQVFLFLHSLRHTITTLVIVEATQALPMILASDKTQLQSVYVMMWASIGAPNNSMSS